MSQHFTSLALPAPRRQPVIAYERAAREGLGHYRTAFCSGPTGTRVGDNWLISSFEVGDAHVSIFTASTICDFTEWPDTY